jgi:hypothetical protein
VEHFIYSRIIDALLKNDKSKRSGSQCISDIIDAKNGHDLKYRLCKNEVPLWIVYELTCKCGDKYIGETSRPLEIRGSDHFIKRNDTSKILDTDKKYHI